MIKCVSSAPWDHTYVQLHLFINDMVPKILAVACEPVLGQSHKGIFRICSLYTCQVLCSILHLDSFNLDNRTTNHIALHHPLTNRRKRMIDMRKVLKHCGQKTKGERGKDPKTRQQRGGRDPEREIVSIALMQSCRLSCLCPKECNASSLIIILQVSFLDSDFSGCLAIWNCHAFFPCLMRIIPSPMCAG